jgi:hypothetical protein
LTSGKYGAEGVLKQLVGPTISEAAAGIANITKAGGGNARPLAKQMLQQIPVVGRGLGNILIPSDKKKRRR